MTDLMFIEDFDATCFGDHKPSTKIIALTPMAMYELDKLSFDYAISEDYFVWTEYEGYEDWFKSWLWLFNDEINKHYEFDIYHCVAMLKDVIDAVFRRCTQWKIMLEVEQPTSISYMMNSRRLGIDIVNSELFFRGQSIYSRIFGYDNKEKQRWLLFDGEEFKDDTNWKDNKLVRGIYDWFRCYCFIPAPSLASCYTKVLLAGVIPNIEKWLRKNGYSVRITKDVPISTTYDFFELGSKVFESISGELDFNYSVIYNLLNNRLTWFANVAVPTMLAYKEHYIKYLKQKKFDVVVFTRRNKLHQYGLLMACNELDVKTIYVRHGWDVFDSWSVYYRRLHYFSRFVSQVSMDGIYYDKIKGVTKTSMVM